MNLSPDEFDEVIARLRWLYHRAETDYARRDEEPQYAEMDTVMRCLMSAVRQLSAAKAALKKVGKHL